MTRIAGTTFADDDPFERFSGGDVARIVLPTLREAITDLRIFNQPTDKCWRLVQLLQEVERAQPERK